MADSDGGSFDEDEMETGNGIDPEAIDQLSEKDQKKWKKNSFTWRTFIDFIFRHIAIVTFKYNSFEKEKLEEFLYAVDKAEELRSTKLVKLKKGEEARISNFKLLRDSTIVLESRNLHKESDSILQLVDLAGRMRCLSMIGMAFYKSMKKGNVRGIDNIKNHLDFWKGFCLRTYDYSQLSYKNAEYANFTERQQKHIAWSTAIRTSINTAQRFLKASSTATGLNLLTPGSANIQKFMRAAEFAVATKMDEIMKDKPKIANPLFPGMNTLLKSTTTQTNDDDKFLDDIDPELLTPIPDNGLLFVLPDDPPKDSKKKGKKSKKGGKGGKKNVGGKKKKKK